MEVFLVDTVRTPFIRRNGAFSDVHAVDLAAVPLAALLRRTGVKSSAVDSLNLGCATPLGEQGMNFAHAAAMAAGWDDTVSAATIDAGAASGLRAFASAFNALSAGSAGIAVVAGAASMTRVPAGATAGVAVGKPFGPSVYARYEGLDGLVAPGVLAEQLADEYELTRQRLDEFVMASMSRCLEASHHPWWSAAIEPVVIPFRSKTKPETTIVNDDRLETSAPLFAPHDFEPSFVKDGVITAGNFASPADGAVAVMLATAEAVERLGLEPRASVRAVSSLGISPTKPSSGLKALTAAASGAGVPLDFLTFDIHEDSAATPLALGEALKFAATNCVLDMNRAGGALSLGDPIGVGGLLSLWLSVGGGQPGEFGAVLTAGSTGQADCVILQHL